MDDNWLKISNCKERDAYYQAGHAVIALSESLEVVRIFVEDDGSSWIDVRYPVVSPSRLGRSIKARSDAKSVIRALLAGPAAEMRYAFGTPSPDVPFPDFNLTDPNMIESEAIWRAISLAGQISQDSPSLLSSLWRRVNRLIHHAETWATIGAVADALLLNGELAGCEVRDVVRFAVDRRAGGF